MATEKRKKNELLYFCKNCDFVTSKKFDYERHITTQKHNRNILVTESIIQATEKNEKHLCCDTCQRIYHNRTGLWRHKKKCSVENKQYNTENHYENTSVKETEKLLQYLIKENADFKQLLIDQNKHMLEIAKNAGSNNTTTNNNNSFNLNLFLNETCKNALNIMDFVNQLQVGVKELEETGRLGFADGISQIFINGLKDLDVSQRPVHCSDFKREILYIKNDDQWNKENEDKTLLTTAIKHIAHKNMKQIPLWQQANPEYNNPDSKQNDRYIKLIYNVMSGSTIEEQQHNIGKIIKNVTKEVIIDKKNKIDI
jgi:hypothetical protein